MSSLLTRQEQKILILRIIRTFYFILFYSQHDYKELTLTLIYVQD